MSSLSDKVPDKLISSASHKSQREKTNRSNPGNKQQDRRNPPIQEQKPDKYKNMQQTYKKKTSNEQTQKPGSVNKIDRSYNRNEDHLEDNRYDANVINKDEEIKPENRLSQNLAGKINLNKKDDENQSKKDDIPKENKDEALLTNPVNDIPNEAILIAKPEESVTALESGNEVDISLPPTSVLLTTKGGSKVYVVGTVHFSLESQKDVAEVIRAVHPDYLVIELCLSRAYMLQWNEEHVLKEAQQMNFKSMKQIIQRSGFVQGGLYLLMLSMTIQITKQLGIAPGGEFRTAYREAANISNCILWFGDRPLEITLHRMLASLSVWQMVKLFFVILFKSEKISKEEVENCKNSDVLERMVMSISKEMPDFANVILNERDLYLTYSLQVAAERSEPNKVVGVVGIGHLAGIKKNWGKVTVEDVQKILTIPPQRKSAKIFKFVFKFACVGLLVYGVHKIASRSVRYTNLFSDQSYWNLSNMMFDIWDSPVIQT